MKKELFVESKLEVLEISAEDVITTSTPEIGGGDEGGTGLPVIPFG